MKLFLTKNDVRLIALRDFRQIMGPEFNFWRWEANINEKLDNFYFGKSPWGCDYATLFSPGVYVSVENERTGKEHIVFGVSEHET